MENSPNDARLMIHRDFSDAQPASLAAALRLFEGADSDWTIDDLKAMLRQQLDASLRVEMENTLNVQIDEELEAFKKQFGESNLTLRKLFTCDQPPERLLRLAKEFAKVSADHPARPLPIGIAKAIYFSAIMTSRRHGLRISQLDEQSLQAGVTWVLGQPWVDDSTRQFLKST